MTDEQMLTSIALVLATKAAEGLADGGRAAFAALARLVRTRFGRRPSAQAALDAAEADPTDDTRVQALRQELEQTATEDPDFDTQLRDLWHDLNPHLTASGNGVINQATGNITGNVVQARDVHGGISFGNPDRPRH